MAQIYACSVLPSKKSSMDPVGSAESTSGDARSRTAEKTPDAVALRKLAAHPPTAVMVKEALTALDSRKGASSQAIQSYIKQSYPSVDVVRLKHLVRNALKKGMESGTLVRPANAAAATTGAQGKFKLAPKVKELKPKAENVDPNVQKAVKAAKDGTKTKKTGAIAKTSANGEKKASKEPKPPKKPKKDENVPPKTAAPAKKPKAKKVESKEPEESSTSTATEVAKSTKRTTKVSQRVAEADGEAPASKRTGKRGKKE
uniref:H15 domain-containing protein n=1 Tax=Oryzias latipes TaxID=8090 RepID=A0A3P9JYZ5_ORYLA